MSEFVLDSSTIKQTVIASVLHYISAESVERRMDVKDATIYGVNVIVRELQAKGIPVLSKEDLHNIRNKVITTGIKADVKKHYTDLLDIIGEYLDERTKS
ncbi:hypothetical protein [Acinetobacter sp.]|uniref:hypothetical protein n=1 Tax=Acinetobacter sp. TaxID=472 RepID=UPI003D07C53D